MDWDEWTSTQQYFNQLGFSKGQISRAFNKALQSQEINSKLLMFHGAVLEPKRCIFKRRVLYNLLVEAGIVEGEDDLAAIADHVINPPSDYPEET